MEAYDPVGATAWDTSLGAGFRYNMSHIEFNKTEYLGLIAGAFAVIGGVAELAHIVRNQSARDISYGFILASMISTGMWVAYHFLKRGGGPLITTSATLVALILVLCLKAYYGDGPRNEDDEQLLRKQRDASLGDTVREARSQPLLV